MTIDANLAEAHDPDPASMSRQADATPLVTRIDGEDAAPINVRIISDDSDDNNYHSIISAITTMGAILTSFLAMHLLDFDQRIINLYKHLFGSMYIGALRQADLMSTVLLILMVFKSILTYVIFDFFLLRPRRRQKRKGKAMLERSA